MTEYTIYFCDTNRQTTSTTFSQLEIQKHYKFNTREIIIYDADIEERSNIGDVYFGYEFMVVVGYEDILIPELVNLDWATYIYTLLDFINVTNERKIKIKPSNNNTLIKYNSIETTYKTLFPILKKLNTKYRTIEVI
ncbi:hypothetical protein PmNV_085 [Penaeus monodon nudivirus]|uniref:Uncharacterized protein n=1 Tax=Penaeus monodon nudivirus TaxID=1529056 RepID=A0A076FD56_9VIRU|nr:hypothetical protein PmNV_085 [Penaeus monodon nudivirus]AII15873.1 hypothetical protein PmNV_085 [Penaeus monodon nudivirus]